MPFSRTMKNISSIRWATVIRELNSIIAEEPLIVCMIRNISLTLSSENVSASSAVSRIPSSCSSRVLVSYRYISRMLSLPLPIKTPPFLIWFWMWGGEAGQRRSTPAHI